MKKALIGIGSLLILVLVVVLFVNAREGVRETKKAAMEMKSDCGKCPSATTCTQPAAEATKTVASKQETTQCDPAACPEHQASATKDMKSCDPATCPEHATAAVKEMKGCDPASCPGHATASSGK